MSNTNQTSETTLKNLNSDIPSAISSEPEELAALVTEQLAASRAILQEVSDIKGYLRWQKIWNTLRFFLIVLPIILGFVYGLLYLPPEVKETIDYYRSLFKF